MYSNELICNILNYLDNNVYSDISIDLLSSTFCYDKFYIMKRFKKEIGISIINYINSMKIYNSLTSFEDDNNILRVSFQYGFNSLEYYSETFKNIIGVSPRIYKKFVKRSIDISYNDISTIVDSLVRLDSLKNYVNNYKKRVKPKDGMVKKLSIFK